MQFYYHITEDYYMCNDCTENFLEISELEETNKECKCIDCGNENAVK